MRLRHHTGCRLSDAAGGARTASASVGREIALALEPLSINLYRGHHPRLCWSPRRSASHDPLAGCGGAGVQVPESEGGTGFSLCTHGRLITAAGVTAGIDLGLTLVGQQHDAATALKVTKRLVVVAQRQGGQSPFSPFLAAPADPESPIARIQDHVLARIGDRHTLDSLAAVASMSPRNLAPSLRAGDRGNTARIHRARPRRCGAHDAGGKRPAAEGPHVRLRLRLS